MKVYEVWIVIEKDDKRVKWGYCIKASSELNAKIEALNQARCKVAKKYSRWKGAQIAFDSIREAFSKDTLHTI